VRSWFGWIHRLTLHHPYGRRDYDGFPVKEGRLVADGMTEDDSLFTITESNLDSGMRGIPVGTCRTSFVDPIEGVHYVGYPVEDLADLEEEDVFYLLMNKRLPTEERPRGRGCILPPYEQAIADGRGVRGIPNRVGAPCDGNANRCATGVGITDPR